MLGLPAYGYVSRSTATNLRSRRRSLPNPVARTLSTGNGESVKDVNNATVGPTPNTVVTVKSEAGSASSGQVQFAGLITQGALIRNVPGASPLFVGAGGFEREWDACSNTVRHVPGLMP